MRENNMRILIICKAFAPDSIIGAIRLTQFAKYFSYYGNDVDVICSGNNSWVDDNNLLDGLSKVNIFRYESIVSDNKNQKRRKKSSLLRKNKLLNKIAHLLYDPYKYYIKEGLNIKKKIINCYNQSLSCKKYDLVLSTYSPVGTLMAGRKISRVQTCKWIVDYRDPMVRPIQSFFYKLINKIYERVYTIKCDVCLCVSEAFKERLIKLFPRKKDNIHLVYNGIVDEAKSTNISFNKSIFTICYTGTIYALQDFSPLFEIIYKNKDIFQKYKDGIKIMYAGKDGTSLIKIAKKYHLEYIVEDMGLISRSDSLILQNDSDLFMVAAWNTKLEKGVLTGKFYEGLASGKPIIGLVAGKIPNSELRILIERLGVGICYEEADKSSFESLENFIIKAFEAKINGGLLKLDRNGLEIEKFYYKNIVLNLCEIISKL